MDVYIFRPQSFLCINIRNSRILERSFHERIFIHEKEVSRKRKKVPLTPVEESPIFSSIQAHMNVHHHDSSLETQQPGIFTTCQRKGQARTRTATHRKTKGETCCVSSFGVILDLVCIVDDVFVFRFSLFLSTSRVPLLDDIRYMPQTVERTSYSTSFC